MEYADIINTLKLRQGRHGIGTALPYLKSATSCFAGEGICPANFFDGGSGDEWQKELADASQRLTYCNDEMETKGIKTSGLSVPNALAEFEHVITTTRKDRDGDLLETKGAKVDVKMPLLWQHLQLQPLGPFAGVIHHDDKSLTGKSVILGTKMGEDVVVLVEGGALRISHGFIPRSYAPLGTSKSGDQEYVSGWHVKEFDIFEVSLVSIPANSDAVITAFSRNKLHSPLVKSWAKSIHDSRPVQTPGFAVERYVFNELAERWQDTQTKKFVSAAEVGLKMTTKMAQAETAGQEKGEKCDKCEVGHYDATGTCAECGHVKEGEHKAVDQTVVSDSKDAGELDTKAGRVLSQKNATKLKQAASMIEEVLASAMDADESEKSTDCGCEKATEPETKETEEALRDKRVDGTEAKSGAAGKDATLHQLARKLAAKMLQSDNHILVEDAAAVVAEAHEMLKHNREQAELAELLR